MGNALLDGKPFRLDPTDVAWDYTVKTSTTKTVGGKVIQIIGTEIGDMTVTGTFGVGGWQEQKAFLDQRIVPMANKQQSGTSQPMTFSFPSHGWNFSVYLKGYSQPGGSGTSVSINNQTPAPQWSLTLFIVEDNTGLHLIGPDLFIARLAAGIGWKGITQWNGAQSYDTINTLLTGAEVGNVRDYIAVSSGLTTGGTDNSE